jgi:hypothetical protein
VLRALDHFQGVGAPDDPRLRDAIELAGKARPKVGRWTLPRGCPGKTYFKLERVGAPSRWSTLRAFRVLRWWNGALVAAG